ncbi:hypothetical protein EPW18_08185 [Campylobacter jejuni]|nr:hypothetical protein [Campylobacter jejuni]EAH7794888.1 hypothetical protein [Campylobacter jejuni]EAI1320916.1 hypothetical protein [Campylobacter jejuni]EAJ6164017.1 hypothetical protein [Campylobacter jejuni]
MRENILIKKLYVDNDIIRDLYKKSLDFAINEREKAINFLYKKTSKGTYNLLSEIKITLESLENSINENMILFGKFAFFFKNPKYYTRQSHQIIAKTSSCYDLLLGLFYHYGFFQDEKQINDILHKLFEAFKVKSDFSLDFQNESPNAKFKEVKLYFEPHFATFYDYLEFEKYLYESEKGE